MAAVLGLLLRSSLSPASSSPSALAEIVGVRHLYAGCTRRGGAVVWGCRGLSSGEAGVKGKGREEGDDGEEKGTEEEEDPAAPSFKDKDEHIAALSDRIEELQAEVEHYQKEALDSSDSFKRALADVENMRERTRKQIENERKFAVQGFVKDLLDVTDNLERALDSVPAEHLTEDSGGAPGSPALDAAAALRLVRSLHEGVSLTDSILKNALRKNGVVRFDPTGEEFNPNDHFAMFEAPDPTQETGVVMHVTKVGYKLHDRIIRPAEVGVVKNE